MNEKKARLLLPGTVVMWDKNQNDLGMVREVRLNGFFVDWENTDHPEWIDYRNAKKISIR